MSVGQCNVCNVCIVCIVAELVVDGGLLLLRMAAEPTNIRIYRTIARSVDGGAEIGDRRSEMMVMVMVMAGR